MNETTRRAPRRVNVPLLLVGVRCSSCTAAHGRVGDVRAWTRRRGAVQAPPRRARDRARAAGVCVGVRLPQASRAGSGRSSCSTRFLIVSPRIPGSARPRRARPRGSQIAGVRLFQPSEPAKLADHRRHGRGHRAVQGPDRRRRATWPRCSAYLAVPLVLILLQPDLGTGLVFVAITLGMLLVGGLKPRWFARRSRVVGRCCSARRSCVNDATCSSSTRRTGCSSSSTRRATRRAPATTSSSPRSRSARAS